MITTARSPDRATLPGRDDHETQRLHHIHPHRHYHIMAHRISNRVVISRRALSGEGQAFQTWELGRLMGQAQGDGLAPDLIGNPSPSRNTRRC